MNCSSGSVLSSLPLKKKKKRQGETSLSAMTLSSSATGRAVLGLGIICTSSLQTGVCKRCEVEAERSVEWCFWEVKDVSLEECTMENPEWNWRQEIREISVAVPDSLFVWVLLGDTQNLMLWLNFGTWETCSSEYCACY